MTETFPVPFGRYQLVERLAVGGMAELFIGQVSGAHGFTKNVVIKRILPHLAADAHFNTMFIDEAKITARLSHPKIAQTLELGNFNGHLYIAMEYVDGLDALAMLRECAHRRARIPLHIAGFIIQEVLDALDFAHNQIGADGEPLNIVHRDVSPSNVLVSKCGDVKLVDFGIAQASEREQQTQGGTLKGKYGSMAPEQVVGETLDPRSDLFSAGIVLAEMAMGRRLFTSPNELDVLLMVRDVKLDRLAKYGKNLDEELDAIIRKSLQKEPNERFQSCAEFREALSQWLFDKRYRVTSRDVSALVKTLYNDAWERKRESGMKLPSVAAQERVARQPLAAQGPIPSDVCGRGASSVGSSDGAEPKERGFAPTSDVGDREMGNLPHIAVDVVAPDAADVAAPDAADVVAPDATDVNASRSIALTDTSSSSESDGKESSLDLSEFTESYDLGDLIGELDGPIAASTNDTHPGRVLETSTSSCDSGSSEGITAGQTTAEIAFDEIFAALDDVIPKDELGRVIEPSVEEAAALRASQPSLDDVDGEPDMTGLLAELPALHILARLAVARSTGLLVVEIGGTRKEIYCKDGRPECVSSNVASELFGEYLVAQKAISDGELSMALAMMPHYGSKLGDTLVGLGLMKPLDVFRQLTCQVRDKLVDVCTWSKGTYRWYSEREYERDAFPLDIDTYEVLGAGAMAMPQVRVDEWIDSVRAQKFMSVKRPKIVPEGFQLGACVRDIYVMLDGTHTVAELEARYSDPDERNRFVRIFYLLAMTELAEPL